MLTDDELHKELIDIEQKAAQWQFKLLSPQCFDLDSQQNSGGVTGSKRLALRRSPKTDPELSSLSSDSEEVDSLSATVSETEQYYQYKITIKDAEKLSRKAKANWLDR